MSIDLVKQQVLIYSNCAPGEGDCMRVSIGNAVGVLIGPEFLKECERKMRRIFTVCDSLKPVGTLVNPLRVGLEVHKLGKGSNMRVYMMDRWEGIRWICDRVEGVWILRLRQVSFVDHCLCVDSKRGLIYDGEGAFRICLTPESLALC